MSQPYDPTAARRPYFAALERARLVAAEHAAAVDREARFPAEAVRALAEGGLLGLTVSQAQGGLGEGLRAFAVTAETLSAACASTAMVYVMHVTAAQALAASTTLEDKDALLQAMARGEHLTTLALSERGSRSQFWAPVSQLAADGGGFVVSADKSWVTSARHAASYVSCSQRPGAASPLESTLYLVRRERPEVAVTGSFDGLGLRGNDSAPVALSRYRLPAADLVTAPGEGAKLVLEVILPWFAVGTAAMAHGLCRAAIAETQRHLGAARFEHTGTELRSLPNLRARLARMWARTEQSRALLGLALAELEQPGETTPLFVLSTRLSALETVLEVTDLALKTTGGAAFSRHLATERLFRDARAGWVMAPTVDHLEDFLGKALTGLPLF